MKFEENKFKSLVVYILWRAGGVPGFGATKLNKAIWFSEARCFEALGKSITGESFIREKFGPVPRNIKPVLDELVEAGEIFAWTEPFYEFQIQRFSVVKPPDISAFSPQELSFIDWWVKHISEEHTARSISDKSHDYGWQVAGMGESLPLHAFLAKRIREPTADEIEWAQQQKPARVKA